MALAAHVWHFQVTSIKSACHPISSLCWYQYLYSQLRLSSADSPLALVHALVYCIIARAGCRHLGRFFTGPYLAS